MNFFEAAEREVSLLAKDHLLSHPFLETIFKHKSLTKEQYSSFLVEIYHLISRTPLYLSRAASFCFEDEWLRDWFLDFAIDERGHDKLCLSDLKKMGLDAEAMVDCMAKPGAQAMAANNFFIAEHNPVALIGFAAATEGMGANIAGDAASIIENGLGFPKNSCGFLKVHGQEDIEHFASVKKAFEHYAEEPRLYAAMLSTWKYTVVNYGRLFSDAMEGVQLIESS